mmetsp:Transcript_13146/g.25869  ORF Transcript_13146/g.25869 Transcript_13146/m.25869 type:complete len:274 (-) Transcript_13146:1247-2068(-)
MEVSCKFVHQLFRHAHAKTGRSNRHVSRHRHRLDTDGGPRQQLKLRHFPPPFSNHRRDHSVRNPNIPSGRSTRFSGNPRFQFILDKLHTLLHLPEGANDGQFFHPGPIRHPTVFHRRPRPLLEFGQARTVRAHQAGNEVRGNPENLLILCFACVHHPSRGIISIPIPVLQVHSRRRHLDDCSSCLQMLLIPETGCVRLQRRKMRSVASSGPHRICWGGREGARERRRSGDLDPGVASLGGHRACGGEGLLIVMMIRKRKSLCLCLWSLLLLEV